MAIVTYVLLSATHSGLAGRFNPEILGLTLTKALLVLFFEFAVVKLGCYLVNIQNGTAVLDLIAYGGYKFVGCVLL